MKEHICLFVHPKKEGKVNKKRDYHIFGLLLSLARGVTFEIYSNKV